MTPLFFDTHCHLQDPRFQDGLGPLLARALERGVTHMVCCGTREEDWGAVLELSRRHPNVLPMLGLHPWYTPDAGPGWLERLASLAEAQRVGIGECGLDFALPDADRELQEGAFRNQLRLAHTLDRPISIHCRRAWERLAAISREEGLPRAGAVIHAFSGSKEVARELQGLGFHFGFGCSLANPANARAAQAIATVAEDRLLFETDAPDIPPRQIPGFEDCVLNEPAHIHLAVEAAARLRRADLESTATLAHGNAERIFGGLLR